MPAYFLYHDVTFRKWGFLNLGVPQRLATVQCMGALLTTIKASTKVVRSREDRTIKSNIRVCSLLVCHCPHKNNGRHASSLYDKYNNRSKLIMAYSTPYH